MRGEAASSVVLSSPRYLRHDENEKEVTDSPSGEFFYLPTVLRRKAGARPNCFQLRFSMADFLRREPRLPGFFQAGEKYGILPASD